MLQQTGSNLVDHQSSFPLHDQKLETSSSDTKYYAAVYTCISILIGMLLVLLVYVACSKRYKLNWFEKTVLQAANDTSETEPFPELVSDPAITTPKSASSQGSGAGAAAGKFFDPQQTSTEFWVPPSLQRQASICQSDTPEFSGDDSFPATPNTPLGTLVSPFSSQNVQERNVATVRYVQPTAGVSTNRSKRTSMHSKLDHTKIDASIYQKPSIKMSNSLEDERGTIQFILSYDPEFSLLCIHLVQARDLIARDFSGTADPYAKLRLLHDRKNCHHSRILKKTLNPVFEEDFAFEVSPTEISSTTLEILIYDFDQYSRHQCMGCVQLPLEYIDLSEKVTLWKNIVPCDEKDDKVELGDLMFSLGYLPSAERLTVVVLKARNLRAVDDSKNSSDVFVKVSILYNGRRLKKKKTTTLRGNLNPVFNEALTFSLSRDILKAVTFELAVLHDNILGQNDQTLGQVLISAQAKGEEGQHFRDMLTSKTAVARWHTLVDV